MDASKLFTLGGLATGGVSAVSGTATSLAGSGVFGAGGIAIHSATQIKDLPSGSKNLYQRTHQECLKDLFPSLTNQDKLKEEVGNTETTESFQLSSAATSSGPVNACLTVDLTYYEKETKSAIAGTIELAATKGDHGVILLNSIGNIFESVKYHFEYRLFFLKRESNNWRIQTGLQWQDPELVNFGSSIDNLAWSGLDDLVLKTPWKGQLCETLSNCRSTLEGSTKKSYLKLFRWASPGSSSKNIWQWLGIKADYGTAGSTSGYDQHFWDGKETPLSTSLTTSNLQSTGLFKDGAWKKCKASTTVDRTSIKTWLDVFKNDKGSWKERLA